MSALDAVARWPVTTAGVMVVGPDGVLASTGRIDEPLRWASVTKVLAALATWIALEEGTVAIDDPTGPPGATLRHLLSHASGLDVDSDAVRARVGERRVYSNRGIELVADAVATGAGMTFGEYLRDGVLEPLGMTGTRLEGSPAHGAVGPVHDLARVAGELLAPTLVSPSMLALAISVAYPRLAGVLPGFGFQAANDWGLGVELRDAKSPHWTPPSASPRTFGHFGRDGGFVWVDPDAAVACACLTDRAFGPWARAEWPALGEAILDEFAGRTGSRRGDE